ncbi:hypothetical protein Ddye_019245 [Dipteronia dyeriana]|uniref:Uncharacterized protein n=1 Tax=Dipteronia dyeriana TaxID=168575 RepID=A0AAD9TYF2_9ROSI|nr:hypothetical protein Ddye_019245 [Dipteronia dyeriana]
MSIFGAVADDIFGNHTSTWCAKMECTMMFALSVLCYVVSLCCLGPVRLCPCGLGCKGGHRVPTVKPYRKKGLDHYEILEDIFNTTTATEQLSFSSSQVPLPSDEDHEVEKNFINSGVHVNVDVEAGDNADADDDDGVELTEVSNKKKRKEGSSVIWFF